MGRATARAAVTTLLSGGAVPYVGNVYSARTYVNEQDYEFYMLNNAVQYVSSPNGSGIVLVVDILDSLRQRQAATGRGAVNDTTIHEVQVEIFLACTGGDPLKAQADFDTAADAMVDLVRANPTVNGQSWSAGEFDAGVRIRQVEPYTDEAGMTVFIPGLLEFQFFEWVAQDV